MSELASMASNKPTNNPSSTTSASSSPAQNANSPVQSSTSSLVSPDSSATNPISSPEAQTPQNSSPLTIANILSSIDAPNNISASTTPTNQIIPTSSASSISLDNNNIPKSLTETKCDSPPIDTKSSGSVHEKASMFERKLSEEQQSSQVNPSTHHHPNPLSLLNNSTLNLTQATLSRLESIYGKKTEEIYGRTTSSSTTSIERVVVETGQFHKVIL